MGAGRTPLLSESAPLGPFPEDAEGRGTGREVSSGEESGACPETMAGQVCSHWGAGPPEILTPQSCCLGDNSAQGEVQSPAWGSSRGCCLPVLASRSVWPVWEACGRGSQMGGVLA